MNPDDRPEYHDPAYAGSLNPAPPPPPYGPPSPHPPPYGPPAQYPPPAHYPSPAQYGAPHDPPPARSSAGTWPAVVTITLAFVGALVSLGGAAILALAGLWIMAWGATLQDEGTTYLVGGAAVLVVAAVVSIVGGALLVMRRRAGRICVVVGAAITLGTTGVLLASSSDPLEWSALRAVLAWSLVPMVAIVCALLPGTGAWCDRRT